MKENMKLLLNRLETTKIPRVGGKLRHVDPESGVSMCPLGHLVDIWINQTPGAHWMEVGPDYYFDPTVGYSTGFPSDEILETFGIDSEAAYRIYRQNDLLEKSLAEVARFIREELI